MKKTLYSLMLSDDVVREVDMLAHRMGTNRSNLINQILADYVSVTTPERRINDIFRTIEELVAPSRELVPFFSPNTPTMSLKSSLEYKYRPTVKYEVQLYRGEEAGLGELSVVFRTQSEALIRAMTEFFRFWKRMEDRQLAPLLSGEIAYALYDGKFVRSIALPACDCTAEDIAQAISDYVTLFDGLMKARLCERISEAEAEARYAESLRDRRVLI